MKTYRVSYRCGYIQKLFVEAIEEEDARAIACDELGIGEEEIVSIEEL